MLSTADGRVAMAVREIGDIHLRGGSTQAHLMKLAK